MLFSCEEKENRFLELFERFVICQEKELELDIEEHRLNEQQVFNSEDMNKQFEKLVQKATGHSE